MQDMQNLRHFHVHMSETVGKHAVRIEIIDDGIAEYKGDFYLAGIIVSGKVNTVE